MSQLFRPITNEAGEVTGYEPIAGTELDGIVREHPIYKEILTETVDRRQTIKEYKAEMKAKEDKLAQLEAQLLGDEKDDDPEPPAQEQQPQLSMDDMIAEVERRLAAKQQAEASAKAERQSLVSKIAGEYNVNPKLLRGSTEADLREHAQALVDEQLVFQEIGVNGESTPPLDDILTKLNKRLNLED